RVLRDHAIWTVSGSVLSMGVVFETAAVVHYDEGGVPTRKLLHRPVGELRDGGRNARVRVGAAHHDIVAAAGMEKPTLHPVLLHQLVRDTDTSIDRDLLQVGDLKELVLGTVIDCGAVEHEGPLGARVDGRSVRDGHE